MKKKLLISSISLFLLATLSLPVYSVVSYTKPTTTKPTTTKSTTTNKTYSNSTRQPIQSFTSSQPEITKIDRYRYYRKYIIYLRETIMKEIPSLAEYVLKDTDYDHHRTWKNSVKVDLYFDNNNQLYKADIKDSRNPNYNFRNELTKLYSIKFKPYDRKYGYGEVYSNQANFHFKLGWLDVELQDWFNKMMSNEYDHSWIPEDTVQAFLVARMTISSFGYDSGYKVSSLEIIKSSGDILFNKGFENRFRNARIYIDREFQDLDEIRFDVVFGVNRNLNPIMDANVFPPGVTDYEVLTSPKSSQTTSNTQVGSTRPVYSSPSDNAGQNAPGPSLAPRGNGGNSATPKAVAKPNNNSYKVPVPLGRSIDSGYATGTSTSPKEYTPKPKSAPTIASRDKTSTSLLNTPPEDNSGGKQIETDIKGVATVDSLLSLPSTINPLYCVLVGRFGTFDNANIAKNHIDLGSISPYIYKVEKDYALLVGVFSNQSDAFELIDALKKKNIAYNVGIKQENTKQVQKQIKKMKKVSK